MTDSKPRYSEKFAKNTKKFAEDCKELFIATTRTYAKENKLDTAEKGSCRVWMPKYVVLEKKECNWLDRDLFFRTVNGIRGFFDKGTYDKTALLHFSKCMPFEAAQAVLKKEGLYLRDESETEHPNDFKIVVYNHPQDEDEEEEEEDGKEIVVAPIPVASKPATPVARSGKISYATIAKATEPVVTAEPEQKHPAIGEVWNWPASSKVWNTFLQSAGAMSLEHRIAIAGFLHLLRTATLFESLSVRLQVLEILDVFFPSIEHEKIAAAVDREEAEDSWKWSMLNKMALTVGKIIQDLEVTQCDALKAVIKSYENAMLLNSKKLRHRIIEDFDVFFQTLDVKPLAKQLERLVEVQKPAVKEKPTGLMQISAVKEVDDKANKAHVEDDGFVKASKTFKPGKKNKSGPLPIPVDVKKEHWSDVDSDHE